MQPAPESPPLPAGAFVRHGTLPITLLVQAAASAAVLAPAVAAPRLLPALQLGTAAVGFYIALVYLAAMLSSQWGTALVRRWGPIRSSQVSLACSAAGLLLVGLPHIAAALAGALLIGLGYGPVTPASSDMLARTTPPHRHALVFSIKQTGVPVGGALAGMLVPGLLVWATGPGAAAGGGGFQAMAAMAAWCLLGAALAQPLHPLLDAGRDPRATWPTFRAMAGPVRLVWGHAGLRQMAACSLVLSVVQVSLTSFMVSWLTADLGWTLVAAGAASSLAQGGGVVGRIWWGWLADRGPGAARTLLGLVLLMMACGLAMALPDGGTRPALVLALLAVYGASAIGWNGVYLSSVARQVPPQQAAAATAGCLFLTYLGVVLGPPAFGLLAGALGSLGMAFALLALPLLGAVAVLARPQPAAVRRA